VKNARQIFRNYHELIAYQLCETDSAMAMYYFQNILDDQKEIPKDKKASDGYPQKPFPTERADQASQAKSKYACLGDPKSWAECDVTRPSKP
jgi:hypothetical protein